MSGSIDMPKTVNDNDVDEEMLINVVTSLNKVLELVIREIGLRHEYNELVERRYVLIKPEEVSRRVYECIDTGLPYETYDLDMRYVGTIRSSTICVNIDPQTKDALLEIRYSVAPPGQGHRIYLDRISPADIYELYINEKKYGVLSKAQEILQKNIDRLTDVIERLKKIVAVLDTLLK